MVDGACPGGGPCILEAIAKDRAILADTSASANDRFIALMALGHWIGDIHQPLHVSFADDRGGGKVLKSGSCGAPNLHAVWDSCILERKILVPGTQIEVDEYADFTPIYRAADWMVEDITPADVAAWSSAEPWQWAAESFDIARRPEVGYCIPKSDGCWYAEGLKIYNGDESLQRRIAIDEAYLERFRPVVVERLKQAGVRLAGTIEQALQE